MFGIRIKIYFFILKYEIINYLVIMQMFVFKVLNS